MTKQARLNRKWQSYTGTGITAKLGRHHLVLRQGVGEGNLFAIILVKGELYEGVPLNVITEIKGTKQEAILQFNAYAKKCKAKIQPVRRLNGSFFNQIIGAINA